MKLSRCSEMKISIVEPREPTPREVFAAAELAKYIEQMLDISVTVTSDHDQASESMILIGGPERNLRTAEYISSAEFDLEVPGPEGMMIRTFGQDVLLLAGSSQNPGESERGTIYAVYEFLERFSGCSFVSYGKPGDELGEYVPFIETIEFNEMVTPQKVCF